MTKNPLWRGLTISVQPRSVVSKREKFYKKTFSDLENSVEKKASARKSVENDSSKKEDRKVVGAAACCGSDAKEMNQVLVTLLGC